MGTRMGWGPVGEEDEGGNPGKGTVQTMRRLATRDKGRRLEKDRRAVDPDGMRNDRKDRGDLHVV